MENLPKYKDTHLVERERVELARDYLVHEFRKIFRDIEWDKVYKAIQYVAPNKESEDIAIRDFWNLFCAMSSGWRLKELYTIITAENIRWEKKEIFIADLYFQTSLGWIKNVGDYNFYRAVSYLINNEELLNESIKERGNRAKGDDNDPIIVIKDNNILKVADGNSRLKLKIENYAKTKNFENLPPKITAWIGSPNGSPKNFWIPTDSFFIMKRLEIDNIEDRLKQLSELAYIEYLKRVKSYP